MQKLVSRPDNFACGYLIYQFPNCLLVLLSAARCYVIWEVLTVLFIKIS